MDRKFQFWRPNWHELSRLPGNGLPMTGKRNAFNARGSFAANLHVGAGNSTARVGLRIAQGLAKPGTVIFNGLLAV
jgi:hypothetical protein